MLKNLSPQNRRSFLQRQAGLGIACSLSPWAASRGRPKFQARPDWPRPHLHLLPK